MSLADLKVGDAAVIYKDGKATKSPVQTVGKRYLTVNGKMFRRSDGSVKGVEYGPQSQLYTVDEWALLEQERAMLKSITDLEEAAKYTFRRDDYTAEEISAIIADIRRLISVIEGKSSNEPS